MEDINEIKEERAYYKGFYEGVKEITTFLSDESIKVEHELEIHTSEDKEDGKGEVTIAAGKIEGEKAKKFIKMLKELGVE